MDYQVFQPHPDLASIVKCYWTLEVPTQESHDRQLVIPDGSIEMFFTLGEDIRRFVSGDEFIIQPREMILGQITKSFYIQPVGYVNTFAVRFYPYGFSNLVACALHELADKETPLAVLFGEEASGELTMQIANATNTAQRIEVIEKFLLERFSEKTVIDSTVQRTIDALIESEGKVSINSILGNDQARRRQLERLFGKQVGISPKKLGRVIRLQSILRLLLHDEPGSLTEIAYQGAYFDQAHFIKDFKEFTGTTPGDFLENKHLRLSALLYKKE